jgi:hypothetical protein
MHKCHKKIYTLVRGPGGWELSSLERLIWRHRVLIERVYINSLTLSFIFSQQISLVHSTSFIEIMGEDFVKRARLERVGLILMPSVVSTIHQSLTRQDRQDIDILNSISK